MASVYKRHHKRPDGTKSRSRCWYYAFTAPDGGRITGKGYTDKEATKAKAAKEERAAERKAAGLTYDLGSGLSPLRPLLDEWQEDMARQGRSQSYLKYCRRYWARILAATGWTRLGEIAPGPMTSYLSKLEGVSDRTANAHREVVNAFCSYGVTRGWLDANPVASVRKTRRGIRPKKKRAFTKDELKALCAASPLMRRQIYMTAALSGLRLGELKKLQWKNVDLGSFEGIDGTYIPYRNPRWRLTAEHTKSRRADVMPMLPECADVLHAMTGHNVPESKLFRSSDFWHHRWASDCKAAGLKTKSESGDLSFHSLRYFFCTELAKVLPIQRVRQLMRHRQIQTTMDLYCQLGIDDLFDEFPTLPSILG